MIETTTSEANSITKSFNKMQPHFSDAYQTLLDPNGMSFDEYRHIYGAVIKENVLKEFETAQDEASKTARQVIAASVREDRRNDQLTDDAALKSFMDEMRKPNAWGDMNFLSTYARATGCGLDITVKEESRIDNSSRSFKTTPTAPQAAGYPTLVIENSHTTYRDDNGVARISSHFELLGVNINNQFYPAPCKTLANGNCLWDCLTISQVMSQDILAKQVMPTPTEVVQPTASAGASSYGMLTNSLQQPSVQKAEQTPPQSVSLAASATAATLVSAQIEQPQPSESSAQIMQGFKDLNEQFSLSQAIALTPEEKEIVITNFNAQERINYNGGKTEESRNAIMGIAYLRQATELQAGYDSLKEVHQENNRVNADECKKIISLSTAEQREVIENMHSNETRSYRNATSEGEKENSIYQSFIRQQQEMLEEIENLRPRPR